MPMHSFDLGTGKINLTDSCAITRATLIPINMRSKYLVIFFVKRVILLEKWMKKINFKNLDMNSRFLELIFTFCEDQLGDQLFVNPCPNDNFLEINSGFATHNFLWKPKDSFELLILALILQFLDKLKNVGVQSRDHLFKNPCPRKSYTWRKNARYIFLYL